MELMNANDIAKLIKAAAKETPVTFSNETFSADQINDAIRDQFKLMAPDYYTFKKNELTIYQLVADSIDSMLPARVAEQYEQFADTKVLSQGDKAVFHQRISDAARARAKSFVTKVGLAGRYETFMLDGRDIEVQTEAVGSAVRLGFEEFLDGRVDFSDLTEIVLEGMDDYIYLEIAKALESATADLPVANVVASNGFDEKAMDGLLAISDSYGNGRSTIICTQEFASTMIPAEGWVSGAMKDERWSKGYLGSYKGHGVTLLAQSMVDATNEAKVIDPSNAYILPSNGEKPVKIAFEGDTVVRTVSDNDDWSQDMQTYKKFGVAVVTAPGITHYKNTALKIATH